MTSNSISYRKKLYHVVENLPPIYQANFKRALSPHKFNLEIYVPKNLKNKHEVSDKNYLRNKLVQFNDNFKEEKAVLSQLKKETQQFSHQYKLVTQNNTFDNDNPVNNKTSQYQQEIMELYKKRGYNEKAIAINENIFNPSLMLELDSNYDIVCEIETEQGLKEDKKFMENMTHILSDKNKKQSVTNRTERNSSFNRQSSSITDYDDLYYANIPIKQIKKENRLLRKDILLTNKSLGDIKPLKALWTEPNKEIIPIPKNKIDKIKVDGIFLSSKGMLRSAKNRVEMNGDKETKIKKKRKSPVKIKKAYKDDKEIQKEKVQSLYNLYTSITKNSFVKEQDKVNTYIKKYSKKKLEPLK